MTVIKLKHFWVLFMLFSQSIAANNSTWLRINNPGNDVVSALGAEAIHYENFLWTQDGALASGLVNRSSTQVVQIDQAFHFRVDNELMDFKSEQVPSDPWFNVNTSAVKNLQLVQFKGPIKSVWLTELKQQGAVLVSPLAPFSWLVWVNDQQLSAINQLPAVRQSQYFYPALRVQAANRNLQLSSVPSMLLVLSSELNQSLHALTQMGAFIEFHSPFNQVLSVVNLQLDGAHYFQAAQLPGVVTLQQVHTDGGARSELSQQTLVDQYDGSVDAVPGYQSWLDDAGVDGSGVVVGVVDGGIYQNHPDLNNVVQCTGAGTGPSCSDGNDAHGTHVAGAIGGTGINGVLDPVGFNRGLGVAPGVRIVEQRYGPLLGGGSGGMVAGGMLSIYKDSAINQVLLTNNSWGPTGTPQGYDIPTMELDMISRDANPDLPGNQPVLAVWSVMNGNGDRNFGTCAPSSLGSPDEAKNLFAVGSTSSQASNLSQVANVFNVSANSGHGPACDGRLVPHIVAPGCLTDAPNSNNGYGTMCGTSMASPVVSGSVALFWQQYKQQHMVDPSPALVKAAFTAVADDLVGNNDADGMVLSHAPNRQQGWGRLNLENVIKPLLPVYYYDQQHVFTETGQNWQVSLAAVDPAKPMRMMLVWTDAPGLGLGGTNPAWVNDLDLQVSAEQSYWGNQFGNDAYSTTGGSADSKNNMEGVFLKADQHQGQNIAVQVVASNITGDALNPHAATAPQQDFALVCYNCKVADAVLDVIFKDGFDEFIDLIFADGFE